MGCGCSKRSRYAAAGMEITGYRVTLPDGRVVPPVGNPPFLSQIEAKAEVRAAGGGTVRTEANKRLK